MIKLNNFKENYDDECMYCGTPVFVPCDQCDDPVCSGCMDEHIESDHGDLMYNISTANNGSRYNL